MTLDGGTLALELRCRAFRWSRWLDGRSTAAGPSGERCRSAPVSRGRRRAGSGTYPQFKSIEAHIRQEIHEALRDDVLEPDDARDLMQQLRGIQFQELREYRVHGWNLPYDDQVRLRAQLSRLDRQVDETRNEP